jgi:DNA-binding NtrC family response regulator
MPGADGFELVRLVKERWPLTEVVIMTAYASIPAAVEAMRLGAYDYVEKPFDPDEVTLVVARALGRSRERANAQLAIGHAVEPSGDESLASLSYREALASARDRGSREYLNALLKMFEGNVSHAAERAGLERESLHRLLRRHGIHADTFRYTGRRGGD